MGTTGPHIANGALRFARYALAPNELGYCGPDDDAALLEQAVALAERPMWSADPESAAAEADLIGGIRSLARSFEGAWPYLELIAGANNLDDPLDDRVVAAYWLGGPLLDRVGGFAAGSHIERSFRSRAGRWWSEVAAALEPGALPSHAFHVLVVGPWVGMLRSGHTEAPLAVMDRCRIRRASVLEVDGDEAVVRTDQLMFSAGRLHRGDEGVASVQRVRIAHDGLRPCGAVRVGDIVAIHWGWVCEVLSPSAAAILQQGESAALERANLALAVPGAADLGGAVP